MNSPEQRQIKDATDMTHKLMLTADEILAVAKLSPAEHKRWVQTAELVLSRPRTGFGRLFKPAETERKLVLFTLSIVVLTILIGTMWYAATEQVPSDALITALTTLAGTGLGFIGGMVTGNKEDEGSAATARNDQPESRAAQQTSGHRVPNVDEGA